MEERKILASVAENRSAFLSFSKHGIAADLSDAGRLIYEAIEEFYDADVAAQHVDLDVIKESLKRKFGKRAGILIDIVNNFGEVSSLNIIKEVIAQRQHAVGQRLASALIDGTDRDEIDALLQEYIDIEDNVQDETHTTVEGIDLYQLAEETSREHKLKVIPGILNYTIRGGLYRGDNILIYGRPNAGKSLVAINMAVGFMAAGHKVLWIENEDAFTRLVPRFVSRILKEPFTEESFQDPSEVEVMQQTLDSTCKDRLVIKRLTPGTFREIASLIEQHRPDVVVINQLKNIHMGKADTNVIQLERAAIAARNFAGKYNVVMINVAQAGETAKNKLKLEKEDVYGSKTDIPGQMDLMIGIGLNDVYFRNNMRKFSLCKSKMGGDSDGATFDVRIDPAISKVYSE